ncbi:hypothetical protein AB1Y20_009347 [Prymnesium parvum]|uniref:Uncharacterized protein n=1 Tax=Prymnesium parvum TaxID=97485 RepID=A0AB34K175_PRYPA
MHSFLTGASFVYCGRHRVRSHICAVYVAGAYARVGNASARADGRAMLDWSKFHLLKEISFNDYMVGGSHS